MHSGHIRRSDQYFSLGIVILVLGTSKQNNERRPGHRSTRQMMFLLPCSSPLLGLFSPIFLVSSFSSSSLLLFVHVVDALWENHAFFVLVKNVFHVILSRYDIFPEFPSIFLFVCVCYYVAHYCPHIKLLRIQSGVFNFLREVPISQDNSVESWDILLMLSCVTLKT